MKKKSGKGKVFVGVSGGVDSSVALALLQKEGYDVTGVFLKVWHPDWLPCDWKEERRSAMRVCATLGVPFLTLDCEGEYKREVVDYMIGEYAAGRTPNPDVFCNKYVKFGAFLHRAREMGADFVATGHYARVVENRNSFSGNVLGEFIHVRLVGERDVPSGHSRSTNLHFQLLESVDKEKDQSYFLYTLDQEQLAHTLFPVGGMTKPEVRKLAARFGLPTATKKDSQGLCFIGKVDMKEFLSHYIETKPGDVLNTEGQVIGRHDGAIFYTIGERHGFTITKKTPSDPRYFVVAKDLDKNTITVAGKKDDHDTVFSAKGLLISNMHWISPPEIVLGKFECSVRIRYRQEKQVCQVEKISDEYRVTFASAQNGVAPGQSAVLYEGETCLGGGIIEKVLG